MILFIMYSFWQFVMPSFNVITVVRAPDDGCQHPKHVELSTDTQ